MVTVGSETSVEDKESLIDLIDNEADEQEEDSFAENDNSNEQEQHKANSNNDRHKNSSTQSPRHNNTSNSSRNVEMRKTSCGDAHNLGLDADGVAYALPSPLTDWGGGLGSSGGRLTVTDVVCGKEHCLLLTEHGQVIQDTF